MVNVNSYISVLAEYSIPIFVHPNSAIFSIVNSFFEKGCNFPDYAEINIIIPPEAGLNPSFSKKKILEK